MAIDNDGLHFDSSAGEGMEDVEARKGQVGDNDDLYTSNFSVGGGEEGDEGTDGKDGDNGDLRFDFVL